MISLTKMEISKYLEDYTKLQFLLYSNPHRKVGLIFNSLMTKEDRFEANNESYYVTMHRVVCFYMAFKQFSLLEDYLLNRDDFLNEEDLNIVKEKGNIFTTDKNITNKKIIKIIRNAFNHNDDDEFDRFKLSVNGRFCEIELKDISDKSNTSGPIPFRMKFDLDYLLEIYKLISDNSRNFFSIELHLEDNFSLKNSDLSAELDKISFSRYYFKNKMDKDVVYDLFYTSDENEDNLRILQKQKLHDIVSQEKVIHRRFTLDDEQKATFMYYLNTMNIIQNLSDIPDNGEGIVEHLLMYRILPFPLLKADLFSNYEKLAVYYQTNPLATYDYITKNLKNMVDNVRSNLYFDILGKFLYKTHNKRCDFAISIMDVDLYCSISIIMFFESVVAHVCNEEIITIGGVNYSRDRIRNSVVHCRWKFSSGGKIVFYDANPRNVNDYKLDRIAEISVGDCYNWAQSYLNNGVDKSMTPR